MKSICICNKELISCLISWTFAHLSFAFRYHAAPQDPTQLEGLPCNSMTSSEKKWIAYPETAVHGKHHSIFCAGILSIPGEETCSSHGTCSANYVGVTTSPGHPIPWDRPSPRYGGWAVAGESIQKDWSRPLQNMSRHQPNPEMLWFPLPPLEISLHLIKSP